MNIGTLTIEMAANVARLQKDMEESRRVVTKTFGSIESDIDRLKGLLGSLFAGIGVTQLVGQLVQVQREFDVLNSSLVTVTGSAAAAERNMVWIEEFAATTPFSLAQVTQGFVKLKALGLDPSREALMSYGNTASAMGKDMMQFIEAIADASTGEFERLKEFGIKARKEGEEVSLTFQGVTTKIRNNADDIVDYLQAIGDVNFAGAMEKRSATLDGAISNLADSWDKLFRTVSEAGVGELMENSVRGTAAAIEDLAKAIRTNKGEIEVIFGVAAGAALVAAIPKMIAGLVALKAAVVALGVVLAANPLTLALLGIGAAVGGFVAYNSAQAKTVEGIRRQIDALDELNKRGPSIYADRDAAGMAKWNAAVAERNEQIKKLKVQVVLLEQAEAGYADTSTAAETARLARYQAAAVAAAQEGVTRATTDKERKKAEKELDAALAERMITVKMVRDAYVQQVEDELDAQDRLEKAIWDEIKLRRQLQVERDTAILDADRAAYEAQQKNLDAQWEATEKLLEQEENANVKMWEDIAQSMTDLMMQGGRSVREYFKGIFRTLVLRPVIEATVRGGLSAVGLGGMNPGGGGGGGGGPDIMSLLPGGGLTGLAGSAISGFGNMIGSTAMSQFGMGMNIGSAALGQMGGVTAAAQAGASLGAALPYIGWALAAISFISGFDDSGTLHMGGGGAFSKAGGATSGFASESLTGFGLTADQYTEAASAQSTELSKAVVGVLDAVSIAFGGAGGFTVGTGFADDSSKDGAWGALRVTRGGRSALDWGAGSDNWPGREFADGEKGREEYMNAIAKDVRDLLIDEAPGWADAMLDGLGDSVTVDGLNTVVQQIVAAQNGLKALGGVMPQLTTLSDTAMTKLVETFGGVGNLVSSFSSFYQSFASEQQRFTDTQRVMRDQFAQLNVDVPQSVDGFYNLVQGLDLADAAQAKLAADLMGLAPTFLQVAQAIEQVRASIARTTDQSLRTIDMAVLDDAGKYAYLDAEIEGLITELSTATLPSEIESLFGQINSDIMEAWSLLDPVEQARLQDEFKDRLIEAQAIADSRLELAGTEADTVQLQAEAAAEQKVAALEQRKAAADALAAATQVRLAAEALRAAANGTGTNRGQVAFG